MPIKAAKGLISRRKSFISSVYTILEKIKRGEAREDALTPHS